MKQRSFINLFVNIILAVLSIVLFVGSLTFLKTCAPMEDGSWMTCHWAGQAIIGVSAVVAALSVLNVCLKNNGIKIGLSISIVFSSILNALIPGTLIHTCMMNEMRCNSITKPGVVALSCVIIVFAIINIILSVRNKNTTNESK